MLFTTATFVVLFLPIVLIGFFAIGRRSELAAATWLLVASVVFYAYWMPWLTLLLLGSIAVNFGIGTRIGQAVEPFGSTGARPIGWLITGLSFNLGLLAYFKYANFFVDNANALLGSHWQLAHVLLPIGISFFTFTQIAYLVDTWYGKVNEVSPIHYALFVTYFPHLVAGPVLHHAQMMPQFAEPSSYRFNGVNFMAGAAIFSLGLFKKVVLADGVAPYADAIFSPADAGAVPTLVEGWLGAWAYAFQLYFDFSGYSDMAIGLSWMFNIRLPFNFASPYQATSISDFWRRWHISLSTFLRDYLYLPLGGNRKGPTRRQINLAVTMVLGGLWHGASWAFVLWGALHGAYLMLNHGFRALAAWAGWSARLQRSATFAVAGWAVTMVAVVIAWIPFRAQSLPGAGRILGALWPISPNGDATHVLLWNAGLQAQTGMAWCLALALVAFALPNSNSTGEWVRAFFSRSAPMYMAGGAAAILAALLLVLLNTARDSVSAFIYFNF